MRKSLSLWRLKCLAKKFITKRKQQRLYQHIDDRIISEYIRFVDKHKYDVMPKQKHGYYEER